MDQAGPEPAEILAAGVKLDTAVRSAAYRDVDVGTLALVEGRLEAARDAVTAWFGQPLSAREGPGFLRYGPGGFYRAHRDQGHHASWPAAVRRRVAMVVFLNEDFSGGVLRLLDAAPAAINVRPSAGTLVAFPAETLHEVTPVHTGTRDVVVDWFY